MPAKTTMMVLLLGGMLVAASEQDFYACTPYDVDECYDRYSEPLLNSHFTPDPVDKFNEHAFEPVCRMIKAKERCHRELVNCPDEVRSSFRHREKGYEAVRDIICEGTPLKDFRVAIGCMKTEDFLHCMIQRQIPVHQEQHPLWHAFCDEYEAEIECYERTFNSSCQLSLESAKAAFARAYDALAVLRGCKESPEDPKNAPSAAGFLKPQMATGAVLLLVLLRRLRTA
ncbi:uncharacterized protein LOC144133020 [Amblyomma americanum]